MLITIPETKPIMKLSHLAFLFVFLLIGCGPENNDQIDFENELIPIEGGRFYGGVFNLNETEYIKTLYPPNIKDVVSARVASLVYEGLFKFNQANLELENCLVNNYSVDSTGKVYSFSLKDSVFFHDDPAFPEGKGRILNSEDIRFCIKNLLTKNSYNYGYDVLLGNIEGSEAFYESSENQEANSHLSGFEVVDRLNFKITLERPDVLFLQKLARHELFIYAPEAYYKYGLDISNHPVGTGAFYLSNTKESSQFILNRNPKYYEKDKYGNQLPYLNQISVRFIQDKKRELREFMEGNLEMVYRLDKDYFKEAMEDRYEVDGGDFSKFQIQQSPEMMTHFIGFNNQKDVYSNKDFRKAIAFAINRKAILDLVLEGEAFTPGYHGITPPSFENYNTTTIRGFVFNQDSAHYYLEKSGLKESIAKTPITLWLNSDGSRNTHVAVAIQKELKKTLNLEIKLEIVPLSVLQEKIIDGTAGFYKIAWSADFPSPKSFLNLFYGKHIRKEGVYPNFCRYQNKAFDQLFELASQSSDLKKANELFLSAEKLVIKDSPIVVLWYDEGYRLLQPYVKNFPNNPMQYRNFNEVYFVKPETLESSAL